MKKVVIYGYYGQKNTGDDYIMLSVINSVLKSRVRDIYVIVKEICFANYSFPKNVHFLALSRNKLIRQLQITFHACKCNKFIIGGGGSMAKRFNWKGIMQLPVGDFIQFFWNKNCFVWN